MNQRGQASSVFNLLIAAIVAISILGVLLGIIKIPGFNKTPSGEAQNVLKSAISTRYTPQLSQEVQWSKNNGITSLSLAEAAGEIDKDHVCVSPGDFLDASSGWEIVEGKTVMYIGSQSIKSKIVAYCGACETGSGLSIEAGTKYNTILSPDNCADVPAFSNLQGDTCCVVALVKV